MSISASVDKEGAPPQRHIKLEEEIFIQKGGHLKKSTQTAKRFCMLNKCLKTGRVKF